MSFFDEIAGTKVSIRNYKSFGDEPQGFEGFSPANIIVGRNNSGKSALLDLVQFCCGNYQFAPFTNNKAANPAVFLDAVVSEDMVARVFSRDTSGGQISGNHYEFGKRYIDRPITVRFETSIESGILASLDSNTHLRGAHFQALAAQIKSPFAGKSFRRLAADRDIIAENDEEQVSISQSGSGFTNIVQRFINKSSLPNALVERTLLEELNRIFAPDATFTNIRVRQHKDGKWEVYLEEASKGAIALTHSGSGLKTVLLVLGFLILIPNIEGSPLDSYVFAFEELENNLHPSLQRRLVRYICDRSLDQNFPAFFTTHSSAVIDMFGRDKNAQIIHVTHSGESACARRVTTYIENRGVLDDLDVRASDLLQANGIVWVEGPSDRLYFNRWMNLVTNGELLEGTHYQCVFYGGRLLAHLSGLGPFEGADHDEAVKIFAVNRNAIVLMDSDKSSEDGAINKTKSRVLSEMDSLGAFAWVTSGREVENYLSFSVLQRRFPDLDLNPTAYESFPAYLERYSAGEGKRFERSKVLFAESIAPFIERSDLNVLDLEAMVLKASREIAKWNRVVATWI